MGLGKRPTLRLQAEVKYLTHNTEADLGGGCRGFALPSPWDDLRLFNTTAILKKKLCGFLVLKKEQNKTKTKHKTRLKNLC